MDIESNEKDLTRVSDKLDLLRNHDGRFRVFGAKSHNYQMSEPIAAGDLEQFELDHSVTLPAGYRDFLLKIGNGGPGPAYGLFDLPGAFNNPWLSLGPLAEPFLLDEASGDNQARDSNYEGCLMISQRGCGGWTFLVVSGPLRGQVWYDDTVADFGFRLGGDSFLSWYESWLDSSLRSDTGAKEGDRGHKLIQELNQIMQESPDQLLQALESLPSEEWLIRPLSELALKLLQGGHPLRSLPFFNHLSDLPVSEAGASRRSQLEALNNGIIAACMAERFTAAADLSDRAQPYVEDNPYIAHSAACAYVFVGDNDKAIEQCRLAVTHGYPLLDQLFADDDLAPLRQHPVFIKLSKNGA